MIINADSAPNKSRKFGENRAYFKGYVKVGGQYRPALFTYDVLNDAIDRAARQPEDAPKDPSFFKRLIMDLQG